MNPSALLVEDDAAIRDLLQYTFERAHFRVYPVGSAERALELLKERLPTIAVIDWMLPALSGASLIERLRRDPRTAPIPLLMVTARGSEEDRVHGLECGADDYLVKPFSPNELVARAHALIRRRAPEYAPGRLSLGPFVLDTEARTVTAAGRRISLRQVEFRLLKLFLAHPNRVFTRNELLDRVWGENVFVEERTVDVHIRRVRLALGPEHRDLISTVRGGGYKLNLNPAAAPAASAIAGTEAATAAPATTAAPAATAATASPAGPSLALSTR
jgi:two-component system phosphate regulon response regulator PhoB